MKRILMIACESERWGPARLPQPLHLAGIEVAVICPAQNPLAHSSFVARHFPLDGLASARAFGKMLGVVLRDWQPDLVIPCDEPIVVMLHHFLKNKRFAGRYLDEKHLAMLQRSIGTLDKLDAMVLKYHTRLLAESLGVRLPKAQKVDSAEEAAKVAAELTYPVYVKKSFSWAGLGTIRCTNQMEVMAAFSQLNSRTSWPKQMARRVLARDWYPVNSAIEVQRDIPGESVMYCVAAVKGKMVAGMFAGRPVRLDPTGPSTVVAIGENAQCREAAEKMIGAMGASGFLAFDFVICDKTGDAYLLECNPRPNQIFHLGDHVGVNLCAALGAALHDDVVEGAAVQGSKTIALFPQEWLRDEQSALDAVQDLDIPKDDPKLFSFMLGKGMKKGHSIDRLKTAIHRSGLDGGRYTFG